MDLFDGIIAAFRRWYVLIPVLIITAALAVVAHNNKTTQYVSDTSISVTSKSVFVTQTAGKGQKVTTRQNALIANGGVTLVSNLLATALEQQSVVQAVATAGGTTNYSASVAEGSSTLTQLPIINISATASTASAVNATMSTLARQYQPALQRLQVDAGVPKAVFAKLFVVQPASAPTRQVLSSARNTGIVIVVGVIVGFALAASLDNVLQRRRRRPTREAEHEPATHSFTPTSR